MFQSVGRRLREKLSYANVVATLALFVALGGASYAAVTLPAGSVGDKQLRNGAITPPKLAFPVAMATGTRESVSVGAPGLPCTGACSFPEPPPTKEHEPPVLTSATLNLRRASHVLLLGAARFEEGNLPYGTEVREGESNEFRVEVREHGAKQPTLEWGTVVLEKANQYRYPPPVSFDRVVDEAAGRHTFALTAQGRVTPGRKAEARNVSLAAIALPASP